MSYNLIKPGRNTFEADYRPAPQNYLQATDLTMNHKENISPAIVDLRAVSFHYTKDVGLSDIDLRVLKGELVVIEGPSGAGKTTLVRLLS